MRRPTASFSQDVVGALVWYYGPLVRPLDAALPNRGIPLPTSPAARRGALRAAPGAAAQLNARIAAGTLPRPDSGCTEQIGDEAGFRTHVGKSGGATTAVLERAPEKKNTPEARRREAKLLSSKNTGVSSSVTRAQKITRGIAPKTAPGDRLTATHGKGGERESEAQKRRGTDIWA
ncbi:hypothetical protein NDU88_000937 [Pleurodeles waltl]|uniref:Uncharacterized protein n=1 Tax=Pleurodeles waltl TaxID=8319 RepID=A0AAV7SXV4_PLEWA|nr:hypothetical protein NDU88_000937 [Pleurodeles waltl]